MLWVIPLKKEILLLDSIPEEQLPEEAGEAQLTRNKLKEFLDSNPVLSESVTKELELLKVSNGKFVEFYSSLLKKLNDKITKDKLEIDLNNIDKAPAVERDRFLEFYKKLSEEDKLFLRQHYPAVLDSMTVVGKAMVDPTVVLQRDDFADYNEKQRLYQQQLSQQLNNRAEIASQSCVTSSDLLKPVEGPSQHFFYNVLSRQNTIKLLNEGKGDQYGKDIREGTYTPSPKNSSEEFNSYFSPDVMQKEESWYLNQGKSNASEAGNTQVARISGSGQRSLNNDPGSFSASPIEAVEKYLYWGGFVISLCAIYISNQVAIAVLRRLNYSQNLVKKLTDRGWPRWVFFWIDYPTPGRLTEKGLFHLMVYWF